MFDDAVLVRVDKNGTKYYESYKCHKCCGTGYIECFNHVAGGVCFDCNGTGKRVYKWKEYTKEYAKKLEQNRINRKKAKAPEYNKQLFDKFGFASDGSVYVVMGNTYARKNELKEIGCRFHRAIGWYHSYKIDGIDMQHFDIADYGTLDIYGMWTIPNEYSNVIKKAQDEYNSRLSNSNHVGSIGDKITVRVTIQRVCCYETQYGYMYVHIMKDADENIFVWKTQTRKIEEGENVSISGKVKEHSEYKGTKQTILTRCKVA